MKKGNAAIPQVLIKWSGLQDASATWEDYHVLRQCFPEAPAQGQAESLAGGDVRLKKVHQRRTPTELENAFLFYHLNFEYDMWAKGQTVMY